MNPPSVSLAVLVQESGGNPSARDVEKLVTRGANVCAYIRGLHSTVLSVLMRHLRIDAVRACFTTSKRIRFDTLTERGFTGPLEVICDPASDPSRAVELLTALMQRLQTHPQDTINWNESVRQDNYSHSVLSAAAKAQRLSRLLPLLPPLTAGAGPFEKSALSLSAVWPSDWHAIPQEQQQQLVLENPLLLEANEATEALMLAYITCPHSPDLSQIATCVNRGADVGVEEGGGGMDGTLLHHCVREGQADVVEVLLTSPLPLDFTKRDSFQRSVFYGIFGGFRAGNSTELTLRLLELLLARLESPLGVRDTPPDWLAHDEISFSFFDTSAEEQVLSPVWNRVKRHVLRALQAEGSGSEQRSAVIPLQPRYVYQWDWDLLSEEDQAYFCLAGSKEKQETPLLSTPFELSQLQKLCVERSPDPKAVQRCVDAGVNVCESDRSCNPILSSFLIHEGSDLRPLAACLSTPHPIDFTSVGSDGWTCLHFLSHAYCKDLVAAERLAMVIQRVQAHPDDTIQWDHSCNYGTTFMEDAVRCSYRCPGRFDLFWELLRASRCCPFDEPPSRYAYQIADDDDDDDEEAEE